MFAKSSLILSFVALAALTACGGGGGGSTDTAAAVAPVVVAPVAGSPVVTAVPVASYASGSEELAAFTLLNAERSRCGFGLLAQNTTLDTAARGHSDWLLINNYTGHYQVAGTTGFTGIGFADRDVAAGYGVSGAFTGTEVQTDAGGPKTGAAVVGVRRLLNAPYHLLGMMRGYRDVGVGVRDKFDIGVSPNNRNYLNIDFGYKNSVGPQVAAAGSVRTYPCEGTTGVNYSLTQETPNPVPGRNLATSPLGSSIGVAVDVGKTLVITSANMIKVSTGAVVTLLAPVVAANDPNATGGVSYFNANEGFVSADAPLEVNTQYQVTINGTSSGVGFSRTFGFTTGTGG